MKADGCQYEEYNRKQFSATVCQIAFTADGLPYTHNTGYYYEKEYAYGFNFRVASCHTKSKYKKGICD